jgi:hypothetical protein
MTNQLQGGPSAGTTFDVISRHQKVQPFHSIAYILAPRFRERERESVRFILVVS